MTPVRSSFLTIKTAVAIRVIIILLVVVDDSNNGGFGTMTPTIKLKIKTKGDKDNG